MPKRARKASSSDIAEIASGRASSRDKREAALGRAGRGRKPRVRTKR